MYIYTVDPIFYLTDRIMRLRQNEGRNSFGFYLDPCPRDSAIYNNIYAAMPVVKFCAEGNIIIPITRNVKICNNKIIIFASLNGL